ncbi:DNA-binding NarL/FixJ family response regulator [Arthrobacter bambusae]|uniref:DNA-binding NarL/FixJ family response regulator n=1 Tax=Arthrobacter bambusae TaxID=1338426 RepID=A0ABV2P0U9_9MICC
MLPPTATGSLIAHVADSSKRPADSAAVNASAALTSRERAFLIKVAGGLTNDEIAAALFIAPLTVKTHLNRAKTKTGTRDRSQLVILAFKAGLADPA